MAPYQELSDAQLMRMVCNANHDAFATLVRRHTKKYFSLAFRSLQNEDDAEDIVQNAFIKIWQKPNSWNSDKSLFTTWFYRVILNACHDHVRRDKHWIKVEPEVIEKSLSPIESVQCDLEDDQESKLRQRCLERALRSLSTAQRDSINLVVYCGLPQKQAAEVMGVSLKALESLLVRAKRALINHVERLQLEFSDPVQKPREVKSSDATQAPAITNTL